MCKHNSRILFLGQCDESLQASRHRGSAARADADGRFSWKNVRNKITVDDIKNVLAFCFYGSGLQNKHVQ